jgi:hypothetical protein
MQALLKKIWPAQNLDHLNIDERQARFLLDATRLVVSLGQMDVLKHTLEGLEESNSPEICCKMPFGYYRELIMRMPRIDQA